MNLKSLIVPVTMSLIATAAAQAGTIEFYGNYTRSDYIRLEREDSGHRFIVLSQFMQTTETRLHVRDMKVMEVYPPITVFTAGQGEQAVRFSIQGDGAYEGNARVTFGSGEARLVTRLATPKVETLYNGYVNRSEYVRVESWSTDGGDPSVSIITSAFNRPTQDRYRVSEVQFLETDPPARAFVATNHFEGTTIRFTVTEGTPATATFQIDDGRVQAVTLLDPSSGD